MWGWNDQHRGRLIMYVFVHGSAQAVASSQVLVNFKQEPPTWTTAIQNHESWAHQIPPLTQGHSIFTSMASQTALDIPSIRVRLRQNNLSNGWWYWTTDIDIVNKTSSYYTPNTTYTHSLLIQPCNSLPQPRLLLNNTQAVMQNIIYNRVTAYIRLVCNIAASGMQPFTSTKTAYFFGSVFSRGAHVKMRICT